MEELREVALAYYDNCNPSLRGRAWEFFRSMDADGDQRISQREFKEFLRRAATTRSLLTQTSLQSSTATVTVGWISKKYSLSTTSSKLGTSSAEGTAYTSQGSILRALSAFRDPIPSLLIYVRDVNSKTWQA
ncbi:hypothetical protein M0R45_000104 [Rubus argutus]|uniref:EF-hand domain-containing protein n=1 Tax=Rubus argutus TaxID=59490 RepID=A0AAW1VLL3_RUBAR